jgi:hypothetical protein
LPDTDGLLRGAPSLSRELESVPAGRRRLGCVVIALAVLVGTSVLMGLFLSSIYMSDPAAMHRTLLDTMSREITARLDPSAAGREEDIAEAFRTLSAANDTGSLGFREIFAVTRTYVETSADGTIDTADVDALIATIRNAVKTATAPRHF